MANFDVGCVLPAVLGILHVGYNQKFSDLDRNQRAAYILSAVLVGG